MVKLGAHINNIALHHIVFALPFAYMSAFLAARGMPPLLDLLWITIAIAGARSAALALDNLADLKYDKKQPRLAYRAMVRGDIKPQEAKLSIIFYLAVCLFAVMQLRPLCLWLLPVAVVPFLIYPYTKRFTFLCHLVLGIAIAMAPAGSWLAIAGELSLPAVILAVAVALWIGAFDAVYGSQDEDFDRAEGLYSLATQFSAHRALIICRFVHAISITCFYALGILMKLHWLYYIGVGIAAGTLVYQHSIVRADDYSRVTQRYFMKNGIVSIAMLIFTVASLYL